MEEQGNFNGSTGIMDYNETLQVNEKPAPTKIKEEIQAKPHHERSDWWGLHISAPTIGALMSWGLARRHTGNVSMRKYVLASLAALSIGTGLVHGQGYLGPPVAPGYCPPSVVALPPPADCKARFCQSTFGQLAHSLLAPLRMATGNLLPGCNSAEVVSRDDVARMLADGSYSLAEINATKIKLDEAHANSRRAAVRYLATVDCHYYPEAEMGLIAALRADRSECVRFEAALVLGNYACPTRRIADALRMSANGEEGDGNPSETSGRVRSAAQSALNRCMARGITESPTQAPPMLPPPDWNAPTPGAAPSAWRVPGPGLPMASYPGMVPGYGVPASYYPTGIPTPVSPSIQQELKRAQPSTSIASGNTVTGPREKQPAPANPSTVPAGPRTLYHLFLQASTPPRRQTP